MSHQSRTPPNINAGVTALLAQLPGANTPQFVEVSPHPDSLPLDCFPNVQKQIKRHGGTLICGWEISEWPEVMMEAQFHAVWRSSNGDLMDISPNQLGEKRILFAEDPTRSYQGRIVNNIRVPIADHILVRRLITVCNQIFEVMARHEIPGGGQVRIVGGDARKHMELEKKRQLLVEKLRHWSQCQKPGRNAPCKCGSGRKFKKCCGG